jgi:hypothetical protein
VSQASLFEEFPHIPSAGEIISSIKGLGYANVPSSIGKSVCQELFADFRTFVELCREPGGQALQDALTYSANQTGNGDYFMSYRVPGQINHLESGDRAPGKDHKYIYHHGALSIGHATSELGGTLPVEMADFLSKCDDMYSEARKVARTCFSALGLEPVMFSGARVDDVHHLRLIDYVASDEPMLGEAHFDRSVATLAIEESDSGLLGAPGQNGYLDLHPEMIGDKTPYPTTDVSDEGFWLGDDLPPVEHQDKVIKFFLAAGVNRLRPDQRKAADGLPLLGHSIRNDRPGQARQAVVMFLNPHNRFRGYSVPTKYETGFGDIRGKIIAHDLRQPQRKLLQVTEAAQAKSA